MAEIHALTAAHLGIGEPVKEIVALLKSTLEAAERGEIIGIAIAKVDGGNSTSNTYESGHADGALLMMAVHSLHYRITKTWYDGAERGSSKEGA
jgi:hypothetical protein